MIGGPQVILYVHSQNLEPMIKGEPTIGYTEGKIRDHGMAYAYVQVIVPVSQVELQESFNYIIKLPKKSKKM